MLFHHTALECRILRDKTPNRVHLHRENTKKRTVINEDEGTYQLNHLYHVYEEIDPEDVIKNSTVELAQ